MHADAIDGSISTEHEDSDQRRRHLASLFRFAMHSSSLTSHKTRRSLPLHPQRHVRMREALLRMRIQEISGPLSVPFSYHSTHAQT